MFAFCSKKIHFTRFGVYGYVDFVQRTVIPKGVQTPETQEHLSGYAGHEGEVQAAAQGPDGGTPALRTLNHWQLPALGQGSASQGSPEKQSQQDRDVCTCGESQGRGNLVALRGLWAGHWGDGGAPMGLWLCVCLFVPPS